jgi:hypothetical protein
MGATAHLAADQTGTLQRLDVFRSGRKRHVKWFRKLAYCLLATRKYAKHPPAGGVAEGMKDGIELGCL